MTNPAQTPELLPCPFCGQDAVLMDLGGFEIGCNGCSVIVCDSGDASEEAAIRAWNRRDAELSEVVAALRDCSIRMNRARDILRKDGNWGMLDTESADAILSRYPESKKENSK